jgi:hypothetical protein
MKAWPSIPVAAGSPIALLLALKIRGVLLLLLLAAGKPSGHRLRRRRLSLPREKISRAPPARHVAIIR